MSRPAPLLLEHTPRVKPDDIPRDRFAFHNWSSYACVEWPEWVQAPAAIFWHETTHAARAGDDTFASPLFEKFLTMYRRWFLLSEDAKMSSIHECQRANTQRASALQTAYRAVHGGYGGYR